MYFAVVSDLAVDVFCLEVCAKEKVAPVKTNASMISFFIALFL
jgi:hypothetical protein